MDGDLQLVCPHVNVLICLFNGYVDRFRLIVYAVLSLNLVSTYFYLPFDEEEDRDIESYQQKYLTWTADDIMSKGRSSEPHPDSARNEALDLVLTQDDLYQVLGLAKSATIDKTTLRRAYLSRSRACHPE